MHLESASNTSPPWNYSSLSFPRKTSIHSEHPPAGFPCPTSSPKWSSSMPPESQESPETSRVSCASQSVDSFANNGNLAFLVPPSSITNLILPSNGVCSCSCWCWSIGIVEVGKSQWLSMEWGCLFICCKRRSSWSVEVGERKWMWLG